jgi:glycolate oxidase FAD binding subunit
MPDQEHLFLDEFGPLSIVQPGAVSEVGALVRRAAAVDMAVYPLGGRTMLNYGLPPTRRGYGVDLRRLNQVIDFPARDMTITVEAGITVRRLQEIAAAENLRLPVDVPLADHATLGGAIATNASGPRRYGLGTLRDYVIGISVVNDEGNETKSGGRVVKNVAGYDLCKLHIGALGTLGIVTQVTLKLRPIPEHSTFVAVWCGKNLLNLLDRLHSTRTRPTVLTVASPRAEGSIFGSAEDSEVDAPGAWHVLVGYEGNADSIGWQIEQLQRELHELGFPIARQWRDDASKLIWSSLVDFPLAHPASVSFKANVLPSATAAFCENLATRQTRLVLHAYAGIGIVIGHIDPATTREEAIQIIRDLLNAAAALQGNLTLFRCPPAWKTDLPVWGNPRSDNWLMRTVKDKLDPKGLFNPGRFVAGI